MAHVIARSSIGPRGDGVGGDNSYDNLILLCPTHHTLIDKAPAGTFPPDLLLSWKAAHESRISNSLVAPHFAARHELNLYVRPRLTANRVCWKTYGPEGDVARSNPQSGAATIWPFRKLSLIVPNNRAVVNAVTSYPSLFSNQEYEVVCRFVEHAEGFEQRCYRFVEGIPRFPEEFSELFDE
jgi:hypothetical protein